MHSFLRSSRHERWIIGSDALPSAGVRRRIGSPDEALVLLRELASDPRGMSALRQIYALALGLSSTFGASDRRVLEALAQRLAVGALKMWSVRMPELPIPVGAEVSASQPADPPPPPPKKATGWVEIVLLDDGDPPSPLGGVRYRVELPSGVVIEGALDDRGMARVEDLEEGDVKVTFPELDDAAWTNA